MKRHLQAATLIAIAALLTTASLQTTIPLTNAAATITAQQLDPALKDLDLKIELLKLTNRHRSIAGLQPLKLGTNPASQIHAQKALEGCYNSHWDRWGLKPYHRLALAGSTGYNLENVLGLNICVNQTDGYAPLKPITTEIKEAVQAWMNSPGHRAAILYPTVNTLHIGLAHDSHNIRIVQHFEADYVRYSQQPYINQDGTLHLAGSFANAKFHEESTIMLYIGYEPPPRSLNRAQLARSYALCIPTVVAHVHRPYKHSNSLRHITRQVSTAPCDDPALIDPATPAPETPEESNSLWKRNKQASATSTPKRSYAVHINAQSVSIVKNNFAISANISGLLNSHGPGIYSVMLLGLPDHMESLSVLTVSPIFWKTSPPQGNPYDSTQQQSDQIR